MCIFHESENAPQRNTLANATDVAPQNGSQRHTETHMKSVCTEAHQTRQLHLLWWGGHFGGAFYVCLLNVKRCRWLFSVYIASYFVHIALFGFASFPHSRRRRRQAQLRAGASQQRRRWRSQSARCQKRVFERQSATSLASASLRKHDAHSPVVVFLASLSISREFMYRD